MAARLDRTTACKAPLGRMLGSLLKHVKPSKAACPGRTKACKAQNSLMLWCLRERVKPKLGPTPWQDDPTWIHVLPWQPIHLLTDMSNRVGIQLGLRRTQSLIKNIAGGTFLLLIELVLISIRVCRRLS